MSFHYIQKLIVNDCYAYQNLIIDTRVQQEEPFKHIILTGPNGSGKTTILKNLITILDSSNIQEDIKNIKTGNIIINDNSLQHKIDAINKLEIIFSENSINIGHLYIVAFFDAKQKFDFNKESKAAHNKYISDFQEYLVNKKINQAFDIIDSKADKVSNTQYFFNTIVDILRRIFHDPLIELEFQRENFEFFLRYANGRRVTLNQLSDGFSAFLSIIGDLLIHADQIRKEKGDYSYDPEGFVLIDEPETHLHLSMQYEVLPLINTLFPRLQLIVATHSPAVISSLKNAIVYDLGSQKTVSSDELVASSFSELMVRHFGLDNEFSNIADDILKQAGEALKAKDTERMKQVLAENERYLTPSLRLELESQLILMQNRMTAA